MSYYLTLYFAISLIYIYQGIRIERTFVALRHRMKKIGAKLHLRNAYIVWLSRIYGVWDRISNRSRWMCGQAYIQSINQ